MKTKPCEDCEQKPAERGRNYCRNCRRRRETNSRDYSNGEYKIGRFGFVFMKVNNDWIRSTLSASEVKTMIRRS